MPLIITCPDCDKKLRVPDNLLNKKVKCPKCATMFTAAPSGETDLVQSTPAPKARPRDERIGREPAPSGRRKPPPPPEPDEDYPRRDDYEDDYEDGRKRGVREGWKKVRMGLGLVATSGWLNLAAIGVFILGMSIVLMIGGLAVASAFKSIGPSGGGRPPSGAPGAAAGGLMAAGMGMILGGLLSLAATALYLTGQGFCMAVPKKPGFATKNLAITAFSLSAAWVALYILGLGTGMLGGAANTDALQMGGSCFQWVGYACALAGHIVFLFFLRSACLAIRDQAMAKSVVTLLIAEAVAVGANILAGILSCGLLMFGAVATVSAASKGNNPGAGLGAMGAAMILLIIVWILMLLVGVAIFIWYILVVQKVRASVDRYLRRLAR
jgi:predicted Zn finger-like uncharacterized protein